MADGRHRCAFLVAGALTDDDALAVGPLRSLGWTVEAVPWRRPDVDWAAFDLVIIRSTWDYHLAPDEFLTTLATIDDRAGLANPLDLVRWNSRKTYLRDLEAAGVPVVPTVFCDRLTRASLDRGFHDLGSDTLVVKPVVGASASGTRLVRRDSTSPDEVGLDERPCLMQPLVTAVLSEGEYSVFYFDGAFSHVVRKTPAPGDFRVQEEHGGRTVVTAADASLRRAADAVLDTLATGPLYARVDLVRAPNASGFWLMELELIEPVLYLAMDREAPGRLAEGVHRWWSARG